MFKLTLVYLIKFIKIKLLLQDMDKKGVLGPGEAIGIILLLVVLGTILFPHLIDNSSKLQEGLYGTTLDKLEFETKLIISTVEELQKVNPSTFDQRQKNELTEIYKETLLLKELVLKDSGKAKLRWDLIFYNAPGKIIDLQNKIKRKLDFLAEPLETEGSKAPLKFVAGPGLSQACEDECTIKGVSAGLLAACVNDCLNKF